MNPATSNTETELKFDADLEFDLPRSFPGLTEVTRRDVHLSAVYWDTVDLRLLSWGSTLRHRGASDASEFGWTLKIPAPLKTPGAVVRNEVSTPGEPNTPPPELVSLVRTLLFSSDFSSDLTPVASIATRRRIVELSAGGPDPLLELADDLVESEVAGAPGPRFRQIEVELLDPIATGPLSEVGDHLGRAGLRPSRTSSKLRRVLGDHPSLLSTPERLGDDATVSQFLSSMIGASARQLLINDPGVRHGKDPEFIHQARVATRRLRSDLKTFGPLLDRDQTGALRAELKWLGGLLGEVRDTQVLEERFVDQGAQLHAEPELVAEVTAALADRAREGHRRLVDEMNGDRYTVLIADLLRWTNEPPVEQTPLSGQPAAKTVRRLARRQWKRSRAMARQLDASASDTQLHDLRRRLKGARYAAQTSRVVGARTKGFTGALGELQDHLGELHDSVVELEYLSAESSRLSPDAAVLASQFRQLAEHHRARLRTDWRQESKTLRKLRFD